jgi:fructose-1,6-bisphosphatase I
MNTKDFHRMNAVFEYNCLCRIILPSLTFALNIFHQMNDFNRNVLALDEFTIRQSKNFPHATGELSGLIRDIGRAAKRINVEVNKAGLVDILGDAGSVNVQGEDVKKLDLFADKQLIGNLRQGISCAGIGSEEQDDFKAFDDDVSKASKYVCLFDPLDGSSNIEVNVSIGTIFAIYRRLTTVGTIAKAEDFLQPGRKLVAAGYIVYGSSTMLVIATRRGVNGFTLDPSIGEFCLSHPDIKCPADGKIYSVNYGYLPQFEEGVKKYISECERRNYTLRYIGSMVSDIHRNLIKGGIFLYPAITSKPKGKLRLQYECNPLAFIVEVAGGVATDGKQSILDIVPTELHQRSPLFIGSRSMMEELQSI